MKARILTPDKWPSTTMQPLLPYIHPDNAAMVVVEDEAGKVGASLAVLRATHFEGLWIDPECRGNAGVARALIRLATALARARGEQWVFGGAADDRMRNILERLGGVPMPLDLFALWVGREKWQT